jgi:hypothetical protein
MPAAMTAMEIRLPCSLIVLHVLSYSALVTAYIPDRVGFLFHTNLQSHINFWAEVEANV